MLISLAIADQDLRKRNQLVDVASPTVSAYPDPSVVYLATNHPTSHLVTRDEGTYQSQPPGTATHWGGTGKEDHSECVLKHTFLLSEDLKLPLLNVPVYDSAGNVAYNLTSYINGVLSSSQLAVVGREGLTRLIIDTTSGACGFNQHYIASDHVKYTLRPRMFLSDRWSLSGDKYSPLMEHSYEFRRHALTISGSIRTVGNDVEHAKIRKIKIPKCSKHNVSGEKFEILTDDTIPAPNLIALVVLVSARVEKCGY